MTFNFPHGKQVQTPFDLKEFKIGKDTAYARPIGWDGVDADGCGNDKDGKPITAIRFAATCPACAQLVEFNASDMFKGSDNSENNIICLSCNAGVELTPNKPAAIAKVVEIKSPFVDPVAGGLMSTSLFDENSQPFKVDE